MWCSVLQCVAVCVAVCCSDRPERESVGREVCVLQSVAECCSVLQCVAVTDLY